MSAPAGSILIIDDDEPLARGVQRLLVGHGRAAVDVCNDPKAAAAKVEALRPSLVLLDLIMPGRRGDEVLAELRQRFPGLPVIMVTGDQDVRDAVRCMKLGAVDYILKPIDGAQLLAAVDRTLERSALEYEATRLRELFCAGRLPAPEAFREIVTEDPAMLRMFAYLEAVSRGSQPVLITGETGTGKELVARALHAASGRRGAFVAVNVAGLDDAMFSDALFGHEPGAFTGARERRKGMIERAGEGTLFLDEIGDLTPSSQVKLLRVIQEREYHPLGSDVTQPLRARVVAATHKPEEQLRKDLYYRLRSYHVRIPPLRDRLGDLPLLVEHLLRQAADDLGKPKPTVPPELYLELSNYTFPGNVRELRALVFDAVARHERGVMSLDAFLEAVAKSPAVTQAAGDLRFPYPMPSLEQIDGAAVEEAMRRVQENQSAAARMLGISRPTIARYIRKAPSSDPAERARGPDG